MASFLLDENISPVVAEQILHKAPEAAIVSIHHWRDGEFMGAEDEILLEAAAEEGFTLVTFDLSTIRPLLKAWAEEQRTHGGVVFIDDKYIAGNDFGALVRAIFVAWERLQDSDFTDGVLFLSSSATSVSK